MMQRALLTKALRDRWLSMAVAAAIVSLWMPMAMAIYQDIDISLYTELPEGLRGLMGIPDGADAATLAYNVILEFAAALTIAGVAVSIGAAAIAGEEQQGTFGLLLSNPTSRRTVAIVKLIALVVMVVGAGLVLWGIAELAPVVLDIDIGATHLGAMTAHLTINALFYGTLAFAIGAATGNRPLASATSAGVMVVSYFAVGLLPLVDPLAGLAKFFPWYYFSGSAPLVNGISWSHLAVLALGCAVFVCAALVGIARRDLRSHGVNESVLDRLRKDPRTNRLVERLAGSTRVSHIWVKTTSDHQALLLTVGVVMFAVLGVMMAPMYRAIETEVAGVADDFPEVILAIAGDGDLSTPEGWYTVETFSLMAPIAVMVLTVTIGARALAGEEADRTVWALLANPIPRSRVVVEKATAMVVYAASVGVATFAGVSLGNLVAGLDMSYRAIAGTCLLVALLGLVFGALALAIGAATGRTKVAVQATIAAAATSHLLDSFLPLSDRLEMWARLTPHYYFLSSDPLTNGMHWGHGAVLALSALALVALAVYAFDRRDLRQG